MRKAKTVEVILEEHKNWILGRDNGVQLCWGNLLKAEKELLREANLYGANLYGANLDGANLYGANLYGASLVRANLYGANLDGEPLTKEELYNGVVMQIHFGIGHSITVARDYVKIGCKEKTLDEWQEFFKQDDWGDQAKSEQAQMDQIPIIRHMLDVIREWRTK